MSACAPIPADRSEDPEITVPGVDLALALDLVT